MSRLTGILLILLPLLLVTASCAHKDRQLRHLTQNAYNHQSRPGNEAVSILEWAELVKEWGDEIDFALCQLEENYYAHLASEHAGVVQQEDQRICAPDPGRTGPPGPPPGLDDD